MGEAHGYFVELSEVETRLPDVDAVFVFLDRAFLGDFEELWVAVDCGTRKRSWFERALGSGEQDIRSLCMLQKSGELAALTFVDDAMSEYLATDPVNPTSPTDAQRMALSSGEPTPAPVELCLQADRTLRAAKEYLRSGERPQWLSYRSRQVAPAAEFD
jgi:hypothetical protein